MREESEGKRVWRSAPGLFFTSLLLGTSSASGANTEWCERWLATPLTHRTLDGVGIADGLDGGELLRLAEIADCAVQHGSLGKIHGTVHLMGDALYAFDKQHGQGAPGAKEFGVVVDGLYEGWRERRLAERASAVES